jgi:hypothetical protein
MNRSYADKDLKLLWGRAAARCCYRGCRIECISDATTQDPVAIIGKIAHIVAHSDHGPRADPSYPANLRDKYENLILLCPTHHDTVDVQPNTFTVRDLRGWKHEHEGWVRVSLTGEMLSVSFAELEIVTKAILMVPAQPAESFVITPPREKLDKNSLSNEVTFFLTMGLAKTQEVGRFVEHMAALDTDFPERLKAGFVDKYNEFLSNGLEGDALFEGLRMFASGGSSVFRNQAAGLAVLSYLFETCEIFKP